MRELYKCIDLSELELLRMRKLVDTAYKSIWENEIQAKELVAKRIINVFDYPHNIKLHLYQGSSKTEFVNVKTNEILASVETINDGIVFYTETKYYGDWFK